MTGIRRMYNSQELCIALRFHSHSQQLKVPFLRRFLCLSSSTDVVDIPESEKLFSA